MAAPRILSPIATAFINDTKRAMRAQALAVRDGCDPGAAGEALMAHALRDCPPPDGAVVSGFWPLEGEIDLRPLLTALHARGHTIVLPVTPKRGQPLTFRVWRPGDAMVAERFGTMCPTGEERSPDFLLVPLLAFDRSGGRLGYGAGYYDRTLPLLPRRFALGCAFAAQEVPEVPMGPQDVRLDAVATEREVVRCASP
ncbi:MAG: 5-formyltetrahydrofolate cyclo-ligase [Acetobacteraceae bacterium]|nr:5-formyltetrahydrofolate cyclo-ligase [Acetobacteraceae bacterium]